MNQEPSLPKAYNPKDHEKKIYDLWLKNDTFKPKFRNSKLEIKNSKRNRFVIDMPPPNVTGQLHIGHVLGSTIQDILTRYHRLCGDETLYVPGTDHAGIATQTVVERKLAKEGKKRREMGREEFVKEVWKWKDEYHQRIVEQLKSLGVSCDWSREAFTLSDGYSDAVNTAFKHLYDKGLIYRDLYIVNWCPKCGTALADDEVEHQAQKTKLYFFKYDNDFPITIATTRPETKLGDTAVAVNPSDSRYKKYVGKEFDVNLDGVKRKIKIIADISIDKEFGTGAVGVTPAHAPADWLLRDKYKLDMVQVIDERGKMTAEAGAGYEGLSTVDAREMLVKYLKDNDLLEKVEEIDNNLSVCYRCGRAIEPLPSLQWFVKMKPLAEKAIEAVKSGEVKIIPKRYEKTYFHWMENIRDWCISRQLWWGHRLPVWYKQENVKCQMSNVKTKTENVKSDNSNGVILNPPAGEMKNLDPSVANTLPQDDKNKSTIFVGETPPDDSGSWVQEEDVLDTWFSSSLFPFASLGWPNDADDYKKYYPTSTLETGYDIIFFWVARMIMMGIELTGKAPFNTVYLHGLVRDEHGRKMSKSLGNVVEPVELSGTWGTDAIRMALVIGTTAGNDVNFSQSRAKGYRNFANKIWNASRFVLNSLHPNSPESNSNQRTNATISNVIASTHDDNQETKQSLSDVISNDSERSREISREYLEMTTENLSDQDRKDLERLDEIIIDVTHLIDQYKFSRAGEILYEYFWHEFADVIIERSKDRLEKDDSDAKAARFVLWQILRSSLIMLHPFMPFVTETIWQEIPLELRGDKLLITAKWPK